MVGFIKVRVPENGANNTDWYTTRNQYKAAEKKGMIKITPGYWGHDDPWLSEKRKNSPKPPSKLASNNDHFKLICLVECAYTCSTLEIEWGIHLLLAICCSVDSTTYNGSVSGVDRVLFNQKR